MFREVAVKKSKVAISSAIAHFKFASLGQIVTNVNFTIYRDGFVYNFFGESNLIVTGVKKI